MPEVGILEHELECGQAEMRLRIVERLIKETLIEDQPGWRQHNDRQRQKTQQAQVEGLRSSAEVTHVSPERPPSIALSA